jgi:hypothetical protein
MVKFVKCLRCHGKWEIPIETLQPEKCLFCKESHFLQVYECLTLEEKQRLEELKKIELENSLKGGIDMANKKQETASEKPKKEKKKSITEQRDIIAKEAITFIESKVEDKAEVRKIHSRMYRMLIGK